MKLPARHNLIKTNDEDPLHFYYYPVIGWVYRKRLTNTLSLLKSKYQQLLEIGFGSGILFPELSLRTNGLHGIEVHDQVLAVAEKMKVEGLTVTLHQASIYQLPYPDGFFDAIVSVSTLEHLDDLDQAYREVKRVTKPGAAIVLSFPVRNVVTDAFYRLFGFTPRDIHPNSHADIVTVAKKHFRLAKVKKFPPGLPDNLALYMSCLFIHD
jgi:ubiquinone/menaquinone biosynthesis C-methylase UbiE